MDTVNSSAPIEETFGATSVHVWPDGIEGSEGRPFGILETAELYTDGAIEAQRLEAGVKGVAWLDVLAEWEAQRDAATLWLEARGLGVWWDTPLEEVPGPGTGSALRLFAIAALVG
ncbi:hypothetical protein [Terrabacter terrigena]|uniref:Uncharacterized protein n=1 Tax=Terrabacter terrigena TaxID=574718 RepID=A0ABW3MZ56_9MICO